MTWAQHLLLDCLLWAGFGLASGYAMHRLPVRYLYRDGFLTRLFGFEREGRVYQRWLRIQVWKRYVPEASSLFGVGFSKHRLIRRDAEYFARFAAETRRAEITHWLQFALLVLMWLINPPSLALIMTAYALLSNVPCMLVQRHNRARLLRMYAQRTAGRARNQVPTFAAR